MLNYYLFSRPSLAKIQYAERKLYVTFICIFGVNKNVFGSFPQLGYSDGVGREVTTNSHTYRDAVSLCFTDDNKLQIKVQIIDKYLGNLLATFAFTEREAEALFISTAENFLNEYRGSLFARAES